MSKIGIMGGTFNPIHYGHLLIAENALDQLGLDKVRFLPNGTPPHKHGNEIIEAVHRLHMVELAIDGRDGFVIDDSEITCDDISYTYLTMERLKQNHPENEYYLIMGGDSLYEFSTWKYPERICRCAILSAAVRDEYQMQQLQTVAIELTKKMNAHITFIQTPNFSVSSSEIRSRIARGQSIRYQLPDSVIEYIKKNNLYQTFEDKEA